jgi:capsular polysaccharide biosynthesis protein
MTPQNGGHDSAGPAVEFISLAAILNILWRHKAMIIVIVTAFAIGGVVFSLSRPEMYKAVATIRPGITSFDSEGEPMRDWRIKDIVRWFNQGMYSQGMRDSLGLGKEDFVPIIDAEFIPRGVGIQGGDVVTLRMLHENPEFADRVLSLSIDLFNNFAESNSVSGSLSLARSQIKNRLALLDNDIEEVRTQIALKDLEISNAEQQLRGLDYQRQQVDVLIEEQALKYTRQGEKSEILERSIESIDSSFTSIEEYLERLLAKDRDAAESDSLLMARGLQELALLKADLSQDRTALAGDLLLGTMTLKNTIWQDKLNALTMRYNKELLKMEDQRELLTRNMAIDSTLVFTTNKIKRLELARDRTLAQEMKAVEQTKVSMTSRLGVLTPLERIGHTIISDGPVYPKKRRMTMTAVMTGIFLALILAFVLEYFLVNRKEIFSDER